MMTPATMSSTSTPPTTNRTHQGNDEAFAVTVTVSPENCRRSNVTVFPLTSPPGALMTRPGNVNVIFASSNMNRPGA